jgi:enoyl-CoA hydratase/carnithine racemase
MTLTGDPIDADTALRYGIVSEVLPSDRLLARAQEIAHAIAANPGHATRMAKRLMREGMDQTFPTHLELAAAYQALSHHTEDHAEAVDAFMNRRAPELRDR